MKKELSKEEKNILFDDFKNIFDKLVNFCEDFHLSIGGLYEPLINKDIFEILDYATKNKNATIYLETNAFLLDNDKAKN